MSSLNLYSSSPPVSMLTFTSACMGGYSRQNKQAIKKQIKQNKRMTSYEPFKCSTVIAPAIATTKCSLNTIQKLSIIESNRQQFTNASEYTLGYTCICVRYMCVIFKIQHSESVTQLAFFTAVVEHKKPCWFLMHHGELMRHGGCGCQGFSESAHT